MEQLSGTIALEKPRHREPWGRDHLFPGGGLYLYLIATLWPTLFFVIGHRTQLKDLEGITKGIYHFSKTLFGKIKYIDVCMCIIQRLGKIGIDEHFLNGACVCVWVGVSVCVDTCVYDYKYMRGC